MIYIIYDHNMVIYYYSLSTTCLTYQNVQHIYDALFHTRLGTFRLLFYVRHDSCIVSYLTSL